MTTGSNKIFPANQPRKMVRSFQSFGDHLCPCPQIYDIITLIISLYHNPEDGDSDVARNFGNFELSYVAVCPGKSS
jgi:hypothetical protein